MQALDFTAHNSFVAAIALAFVTGMVLAYIGYRAILDFTDTRRVTRADRRRRDLVASFERRVR